MEIPSLYDVIVIAVISIAMAFILFPIVFFMAYYYEKLEKKSPKTPKILLMLFCTILGTLIAVVLGYLYLKYSFFPYAFPIG
ncbi:MAG: hypothetical protein WC408_05585 [Candidatus Micrarchaeia archaeon]|jgi:multisubunit Na+/H+ antiporter MnhB subunit